MLKLLQDMAKRVGVDCQNDPDIETLEQATCPEKLVQQIDESIGDSDASEKTAKQGAQGDAAAPPR